MVFRALFSKIKQGLAKTRDVFSGVAGLFRLKGRVDQQFLEELEKRLYLADVGTAATAQISERVRQAFLDKEITGDVEKFVKEQLKELLTAPEEGLRYNLAGPTIVMVAGVNGSGKTTSIAKLARH
ncbi:MAG TPA: signal recognition particle receptor subunit alpha, partial [Gemmataceae bacterium]|nr:signal recognition particle receptor subunit alpha [Gemmataceae bacterium]